MNLLVTELDARPDVPSRRLRFIYRCPYCRGRAAFIAAVNRNIVACIPKVAERHPKFLPPLAPVVGDCS